MPESGDTSSRPPRRVLVVEDDADIREALTAVLEDDGFVVVGAENGAEALARLRDSPAPHVVVLDLMMPVLDGFAFLEERARDPELARIPVIICSATVPPDKASMSGVPVLRKPPELPRLLELVERLSGASP